MKSGMEPQPDLRAYPVWDISTRWFHWINFICVLGLSVLGLAILNEKSFGVSAEGKILLKTLHTYVGYAFAANLVWRLVWAFIGSTHARWQAVLPIGSGYISELRQYLRGFLSGNTSGYVGHNPLSRLMVSLLLLILVSQSLTGLVLAGTDLYMPPFGSLIADWVTDGDPDRLAQLVPGTKEHVDPTSYDDMRSFRSPIITTHLYGFYLLMFAVFLHITGVVVTEIRERNGLISALFTGEKVLSKTPVDLAPRSAQPKRRALD
ncbi:MAG: cytochrome b/b6 domain-containing protein [Pseudomonadales bacterium]|nr:cytochrome b/b6 domain-containing protein [Pseudomonadales bacterium]